jgi:hypothetical protein
MKGEHKSRGRDRDSARGWTVFVIVGGQVVKGNSRNIERSGASQPWIL